MSRVGVYRASPEEAGTTFSTGPDSLGSAAGSRPSHIRGAIGWTLLLPNTTPLDWDRSKLMEVSGTMPRRQIPAAFTV